MNSANVDLQKFLAGFFKLIVQVKAKFAAEQQATSRRVELQESGWSFAQPRQRIMNWWLKSDLVSPRSQAIFLLFFHIGVPSQGRKQWEKI